MVILFIASTQDLEQGQALSRCLFIKSRLEDKLSLFIKVEPQTRSQTQYSHKHRHGFVNRHGVLTLVKLATEQAPAPGLEREGEQTQVAALTL